MSGFYPRVAVLALLLFIPLFAHAFPFGGRANIVLQCVYNSTIYTNLGPPRGGEYIWTSGTRTYQFGPPAYAGQWILGLAAPPYYCIYKISPIEIYTGIAITMMGSSGAAAPAARATTPITFGTFGSGSGSGSSGTGGTGGTTGGTGGSGVAKIVISEVFFAVDAAHGAKPSNEWVELYNAGTTAVDVSGWYLQDDATSRALPAGSVIAAGQFMVASASSTKNYWSIPQPLAELSGPIGNGLVNAGDRVLLRDKNGNVVDSVSWGTNTTALSPAPATVGAGHSLARTSPGTDTNAASDWIDRTTPTPGR